MLQNVPIPGQSNDKTSAVIFNDETTSAPKGFNFNHLSQLKGERIGDAVCVPSIQPSPILVVAPEGFQTFQKSQKMQIR